MPSVGKTPGRTRLYALDAAEVSLVPRGMNKRKFLIMKSAEKVEMGGPGSGPQKGGGSKGGDKEPPKKGGGSKGGDKEPPKEGEKGFKSYHNGNEIEHTGNSKVMHGGLFHEAKLTEGSRKGETVHVRDTQDKAKEIAHDNAVRTRGAVPQLGGPKSPTKKSAEGKNVAKSNAATLKEMKEAIAKVNPEIMGRVEDCMKRYGVEKSEDDYAGNDDAAKDAPLDMQSQAAVKAVVRILAPFKEKLPPLLMHEVLDAAGFEVTAPENGGGDGAHGVDDDSSALGDSDEDIEKTELTTEGRKHIAENNFALSGRRYPIQDLAHARNALARSSGKPEEGQVKAAVYRKYPALKERSEKDDGDDTPSMPADITGGSITKDDGEGGGTGYGMRPGGEDHGHHEEDEDDDMEGDEREDDREEKEAMFMAIPARVESEDDEPFAGSTVKKGHMHAAAEAATKAFSEHLQKLGYDKYPTAKMGFAREMGDEDKNVKKGKGETVAKSNVAASPREREAQRKLELVQKAANDKIQGLEREILGMKAAERRKEIVAKAAEFTYLGLPSDDVVAQLLDADRLGKESFERVCKSFTALSNQNKTSGLFSEMGSSLSMSAGSNGTSENAWAKIEAGAMGLVQKSAGGGAPMSKDQATTAFLQTAEGQRLYAEYKSGRAHGA